MSSSQIPGESVEEVQMRNRFVPSSALGIALAMVLFVPAFVAGQGPSGAAKTGAKTGTKAWTAPRTADGKPDLHGYWTSESFTPLERPAKYAGREFLTDEEVAAAQKDGLQREYDRPANDPERTLSNLTTFGLTASEEGFVTNKRTSLIVDPPDGKMPPRTPEALKRPRAIGDRDYIEVDSKGAVAVHADTPKDIGVRTSCVSLSGGPPILPGGYNNGLYIMQNPNYVVLQAEYGTEVRIVPLDARPHAGASIQQWHGDGRGHWEGDTLVVETTNFRPEATFRNANPQTLKIVERFKRVAADQIEYSFTIDDPSTWTKPWTALVPLKAIAGPIFEYDCSESNNDIINIMAGARADEKAAEQKAKGASPISQK
jgi:hypothetical protein